MKTIALYARVSSEQQAQQATIDSQIVELRQRAEADGYKVLPDDIFTDDGYSGTTINRPSLERLRDRLAQDGIDILYVHSPDRLARKYAYQVLLLEEFKRCGTSVVFVHGLAGDTPEERLLVQVQGVIAEYERAKLMERCRRGKLHRAREGHVSTLTQAPYGFRYIKKTDQEPARYEVDTAEAEIVREMFKWLVYEQAPIRAIARRLDKRGITPRKGGPHWSCASIATMLRNPAYMGKAAYRKTETVESRSPGKKIRGRNSIPRRVKSSSRDRPTEEWIYIPVPAIVSEELFAAASEQLERNRQLAKRNVRGNRYLLKGLIVCAKCGYRFQARQRPATKSDGSTRYTSYNCPGTRKSQNPAGQRICDNKGVRGNQIEPYVWESVRALLQEPKRLIAEWARRSDSDSALTELRELHGNAVGFLAQQERGLKRLLDAYETGALELDELTERSKRARTRIQHAQRNLKEVEVELSEVVDIQSVADRLDAFAERVRQRLDELSWLERQQLIRLLVSRIELDAESATVIYRVPRGNHTGSSTNQAGEGGSSLSGEKGQLRLRGRESPADCE